MKKYLLNSRVAADNFDGELIIANLDTGLYYTLNGTILNVIKKLPIQNPEEVINTISTQFPDQSDEVKNDLHKLWKELKDEKLIVESEIVPKNYKIIEIDIPLVFSYSKLNRYADMQDLLLLDPIHEVDDDGWPLQEKENVTDESIKKE